MARQSEQEVLIDTLELYTDAGSLNRVKKAKADDEDRRFLKLNGPGRRKNAATTISVWEKDLQESGDKKIIVKVYSIERTRGPASAKPLEYLFILGLIAAIVAGYFLILVL